MSREHKVPDLAPGDVVGRYRLVQMLGEGAMGRVWQADGPSGPVAVKLLTKRDSTVRARFDLEAKALLKLRHPNIVRAVDYGHAPDGTPFIAMEFLDGESVEERLGRDGKMPIREALAMAHDAARGLGAAHQMGIVHRDVKPGNLFMCRDGTTKVLDFGIALWEPHEGLKPLAKSRLTQPGSVLGTPSYMAPEQAKGERDEDPRTDVWGLCAVVYDAISGRPPFDANGNNLAEIVRILTEPPDPLPNDVPSGVADLIYRGLQRAREDRFASMQDFAAALAEPLGDRVSHEIIDEPSFVGGALADEVRMVSAVLFEGVKRIRASDFEELARRHGGVGSLLRQGYAVAVFGAESRSGDEAAQATRMALEARKLRVRRIGIGTGKAVRRVDKRGLVTGQAIAAAQLAITSVTASKHMTLKAGATLSDDLRPPVGACPETQERIRDGFIVHGGRVLDEEVSPHSRRPRHIGGAAVPFVGRDDELDELLEMVDEAAEERASAAVLVSGPPGIGKSRLRYELLTRLRADGVRVLKARGDVAHSQGSLGIVRELVRGQLDTAAVRDRSSGIRLVQDMVGDAGDESTAPFIGELLGYPFAENEYLAAARSDPQLMVDRIRRAVADLLRAWGASDPVVITVEDGQRADTASLEWLEWMVDELVDVPLVLMVFVRPAFFVGEHPLLLAPVLELGELDDGAVASIVSYVLGRPEKAVVERAAGNPYFAEELALALLGGAQLDALPATVEGAVQARLDKLASDEKDLLKRASVLGQRFWQEGLEALGEPRAPALLTGLALLGLVAKQPDSRLAGCHEWQFKQAIVQEVCHGMLTLEQRQSLHLSAAHWLSSWPDVEPHEVAAHFEVAGERNHAGLWWIRAITQAHGRGDAHNVVRFEGRMRGVAAELPASDRFAIQLLLIESLHWLGERERLGLELDRARALADEEGPAIGDGARAKMWRWHAQHMQQTGHVGAGLVAANQAVKLADAAAIDVLRARCRGTLAALQAIRGDLNAASAMAEEAVSIVAGIGGPLDRAHAAHARGFVFAQCGHHFNALVHFRSSRNICVELGAVHEGALDDVAMGRSLCFCGDYASAYMLLARAESTGEQLALETVVGWAKHHLGVAKFGSGDAASALEDEDAAFEIGRRTGDALLAVSALQARSLMRSHRGRHQSALDDANRALALTGNTAHSADAISHCARAVALVGLERFGDAVDACDAAFDARSTTGMAEYQGDLFVAHHTSLSRLGRKDEARASLLAARRYIEAALAEIGDDSLRRAFTQNVSAHRRLLPLIEAT